MRSVYSPEFAVHEKSTDNREFEFAGSWSITKQHTHTKWTCQVPRVVGSGEVGVVHPVAADSAIADVVAVVVEVPAWVG